MNETATLRQHTEDLGIGAYLRMHGFKVVGRKGKTFFFDIQATEEEAFNESVFEYPNSPYHDFDANIMALKKLPHFTRQLTDLVRMNTEDLGVAAYLRMNGFKIVGRKGRAFFFDIQATEEEAFNETIFDYPNSTYHDFDANLMALKKLPHYIPAT